MAVVSTPSLSLRDFIQRILPMVVAVCLFAPFFPGLAGKLTLEGLIVGAAILAYLTAEPLSQWVFWPLTRRLPHVGRKLKRQEQERRWVKANWDFDRLLFALSKDDSESLYVNYSYMEFYRRVGFLMLIYALLNLYRVVSGVVNSSDEGSAALARAAAITTPMFGDWSVSSLLVAGFALLLAYSSFEQFLAFHRDFFLRRGQYALLGQLYHKDKGGIAVSIWGNVVRDGAAASGVEVRLLSDDDDILAHTLTEEDGRFQFPGWYKKNPTARLKLLAVAPEWHAEMPAPLSANEVPRFDIESEEGRAQDFETESACRAPRKARASEPT
jgi:hypothetical protein